MSGGSMDYLYRKVEQAKFTTGVPERDAFAKHLKLVAKALHDIEWVDSADYSPGDEYAAIRACLGEGAVLQTVVDAARVVLADLQRELIALEEKHGATASAWVRRDLEPTPPGPEPVTLRVVKMLTLPQALKRLRKRGGWIRRAGWDRHAWLSPVSFSAHSPLSFSVDQLVAEDWVWSPPDP